MSLIKQLRRRCREQRRLQNELTLYQRISRYSEVIQFFLFVKTRIENMEHSVKLNICFLKIIISVMAHVLPTEQNLVISHFFLKTTAKNYNAREQPLYCLLNNLLRYCLCTTTPCWRLLSPFDHFYADALKFAINFSPWYATISHGPTPLQVTTE